MQKFKMQTSFITMYFLYKANTLFRIFKDHKGKEKMEIIKGGSLQECRAYVENIFKAKLELEE